MLVSQDTRCIIKDFVRRMRDADWKDCVDFGYWMFQKIRCHKCNKVVTYSCHTQNEFDEYCLNSPVKFWCEDCLIKELHLTGKEDIEKACEGPHQIYARYIQEGGFCEHGNSKAGCYCCGKGCEVRKGKFPRTLHKSMKKDWWKFW